jgi:hypothetical protein
MARDYRKYSDDDVINASKRSESMAQLLDELGLTLAGGNYANMKRTLQRLQIDCSHWTGQAWNKGEQLKDWEEYAKSSSIKRNLLREQGNICQQCGRTEWEGEPIPLELDHIDGDRTNHSRNNIRLICCNCHALTPTWRGRNARTKAIDISG